MNLELPFDQAQPSELDEYLARVDVELDALFLQAIAESFETHGAEPDADAAAA